MERVFERRIDALDEIFRFVNAELVSAGILAEHGFAVAMAIEELFTNAIKNNPKNRQAITIALEREGERLRITFTEYGVEPFDIRTVPAPRIDAPIEERVPGGLGIHLVRQLADEIDYSFEEGRSRTTVFRRIS